MSMLGLSMSAKSRPVHGPSYIPNFAETEDIVALFVQYTDNTGMYSFRLVSVTFIYIQPPSGLLPYNRSFAGLDGG